MRIDLKQNITLILTDGITFFFKMHHLFPAEHSEPCKSRCNHAHKLLFMPRMTEQGYESQKHARALELFFLSLSSFSLCFLAYLFL